MLPTALSGVASALTRLSRFLGVAMAMLTIAAIGSPAKAQQAPAQGFSGFEPALNIPNITDGSLAVSDLNSDGALDIITANTIQYSIIFSNGNGTFQGPQNFPISIMGLFPIDLNLAVADMNGDNIPDLIEGVAFNPVNPNTILLMLGNSDGTFMQPAVFEGGDFISSVAVADLNADGAMDIVTTNRFSIPTSHVNTVSVLLGMGDGTFSPRQTYDVGEQPHFSAISDLNGDGILDVAVANSGTSDNSDLTIANISILFGVGDGTFDPQVNILIPSTISPVREQPRTISINDFNSDGVNDLAVGMAFSAGQSRLFFGLGGGAFAPQSLVYLGTPGNSVIGGDFDGDGDVDLASANSLSNDVVIQLNLGNGLFAPSPQFSYAVENMAESIALGDFNADGFVDIAVENISSGSVSILINRGNAPLPNSSDLNGDGVVNAADLAQLLVNWGVQ